MWLRWCVAYLMLCLLVAAPTARAQNEEEPPPGLEEPELGSGKLGREEALALLAQPLPDAASAADARYALLQRQARAAQALDERARYIELLAALAQAGRGRPGGEDWIRHYLSAEFIWGSSGKALAACETFIADAGLSLPTRAAVALRQSYFSAQGHDRHVLARLWSRAATLSSAAIKELALADPPAAQRMQIERLQVRAEVERWDGDLAGAVASLREAVRLGQQLVQQLRALRGAAPGSRDPAVLDAYGWLDGSMGMLCYALVRQGRAPEAVAVAQDQLALWRAGQLSDSLGARWNYRLAMGLVATQRYEPGLAAAQLAEQMLQRAGASAASHTRWMARQEQLRALIGLRRWAEADAIYRDFLASLPDDGLARQRASDWRLRALLAAKNGRLEEALETVERMLAFRLRLYGSAHPQTQEAAGVRALVRLMRGELAGALSDYEALFAATLDSPGGWLDLDLRGVRGYVLGLALEEFMQFVAERALKGLPVEPAWSERALQIADRTQLGSTQRALSDSTARVLAATPALRAMLNEEQGLRSAAAAQASSMAASLTQEDRMRRSMSGEAWKALPDTERKAQREALAQLREQIKAQQAVVLAARAALQAQRDKVGQAFPAYADLVTPATPRAAQLLSLLRPGEALLLVQPLERATLVWLLGPGTQSRFHASAVTAAGWAERVAALRRQLDLGSAGKLLPLPAAGLHEVYRELLEPLRPDWRELRSLMVASDGALAGLPFAALLSAPSAPAAAQQPWLVRRVALTQLPAASALHSLRRAGARPLAAKALIGFGDPAFQFEGQPAAAGRSLDARAARYDAEWGFRYGEIPALPETRQELLALAAVLGADASADLLLGAQATREAVLQAPLADRRVVAFATHGLMPGELPGVSKPALAMAASADPHASPLLELDDVLSLRLNAQTVLLSACNTAAGERGRAAMSGLVRGFFFAGTRSVLATHWAVESASAAALSAASFKHQAAASRAEALRLAQLALIEGELGGGRWTHPFYWAGYALFGDPQQ
ncbi:CHAT domain-containing protein [Paucibacter soli]|uniref:CHAT domain-containing protein n=1 Tax=Paucibacter soli TaxID=3133433 RepID=UPI0030A3B0A9